MRIEGTHKLSAQRERVFDALTDPAVLQKCIPGCEQLEKTAADQYNAILSIGVGPIKGKFTATVALQDLRRPEHYRLAVEGKGQPGFVKGTGELDLGEEAGATLIGYSGDVHLGGLLASVGQRMIQATANMMIGKFFAALDEETKASQTVS